MVGTGTKKLIWDVLDKWESWAGRKVSGIEKLPRCVGFLHGKLNLASKIYEGRTKTKLLPLPSPPFAGLQLSATAHAIILCRAEQAAHLDPDMTDAAISLTLWRTQKFSHGFSSDQCSQMPNLEPHSFKPEGPNSYNQTIWL